MADSMIVRRLLEFGYSQRSANFYANIHTLTENGTKGIEAFEPSQEQSLDAILPPRGPRGTTSCERLDLQRMFTEPSYRQDYFYFYRHYVLPELRPELRGEAAPQPKSAARKLVDRIASLVR